MALDPGPEGNILGIKLATAAPVKPGLADPSALRDAKFVVWIRPATLESVREICENPRALGCQRWKNGVCYVVAMDYGGDTLTTLGHELKHCFDGDWHSDGIIRSSSD